MILVVGVTQAKAEPADGSTREDRDSRIAVCSSPVLPVEHWRVLVRSGTPSAFEVPPMSKSPSEEPWRRLASYVREAAAS